MACNKKPSKQRCSSYGQLFRIVIIENRIQNPVISLPATHGLKPGGCDGQHLPGEWFTRLIHETLSLTGIYLREPFLSRFSLLQRCNRIHHPARLTGDSLNNCTGNRNLILRRLRERNTNRISNPLCQQCSRPCGGDDSPVLTLTRLSDAQMYGVVHPLINHHPHQEPVGHNHRECV